MFPLNGSRTVAILRISGLSKKADKIHHHVKYEELSPVWYEFFSENGVFPEIYFTATDLDDMNRDKALSLEKDLHGRNLGLSIHAPFLDLSPGAFDPKIAEVTQLRLNQTLDLAEILKPSLIDCHLHYDRHRFGGRLNQWVENAARLFEKIVKRAEKIRAVLVVENTFEEEPTPLSLLIDKIGSPFLQACFDNGHFHIFHKVPLKKWWDLLGSKIALLHLHDNHGERDEHLPIGQGNFPFPAYFNLLKDYRHEMTYTLECHSLPDAEKTLRALRRFLEQN